MSIFVCCDEEYHESHSVALVVEGTIEDGGFPIVTLTKSLHISSEYQDISDLSDFIVKWAKVTVSDGTDEVVLTGKYDDRYFPPFVYTTGRMKGEAGKKYKLIVEYKDYHAESTTTIPQSPSIDGFEVKTCEGNDTLYQVNISFHDDKKAKSYYQVFTRVGTDTKTYNAAYLGSFDSDNIKEHATVSATRGWKLKQENYTPYFLKSDTVSVKFARVDSISFNFWNDYSKSLSFSNNMFMPMKTNIRSNIEGGLGYWCGMGVDVINVIIAEHER